MSDTAVLLLAGGVGSRLSVLVEKRAKPAVPFGGIYRIIDFTLSNIANSDLKNVAVLTQYKPLSLMDHVGNGSSWDLFGRSRSVRILPPKTGEKDWDWYKGTADAVRQNLAFIAKAGYDHVLILSGDHVYYMDYRAMIRFHCENGAKVTIAMIRVPYSETHQFGTGIVDEQLHVVQWEEKSPRAKSNLASMGIYVFNRDCLVGLLEETKDKDFGHHIIPRALREGTVFAYPFDGYWRDVGTIQAYWDANMDLLKPESGLTPELWKVMTNVAADGISYDRPPAKVTTAARAVNSVVSPGCTISGRVEHSVLSPGVVVERGAFVKDSIIMHDSIIREGAVVQKCIVDKEVSVGRKAVIGRGKQSITNDRFPDQLTSGLSLIGKRAIIPDNVIIDSNCVVYPLVEEDYTGPDFPSGSIIYRTIKGEETNYNKKQNR